MLFNLPPPLQPPTSPSNFADSRWSREVSEVQTLHTQFQLLTTILGMSIQQNLLLLTQMTSGTLLHPVPFYLSVPSFPPESPASKILITQPSLTGTSPYQLLSQTQSPLPFILPGEKLRHQSPDHPEHELPGSSLPGSSENNHPPSGHHSDKS